MSPAEGTASGGFLREKEATGGHLLRRPPGHHTLLHPFPLSPGQGARCAARLGGAASDPGIRGSPPAQGAVAAFQLGPVFGFVHGDGSAAYVGKTPFRVSLSESGFVNFTRLSTDWILQDSRGDARAELLGQRVSPAEPRGEQNLQCKDGPFRDHRAGQERGGLWSRDFPSMMTSAAHPAATLWSSACSMAPCSLSIDRARPCSLTRQGPRASRSSSETAVSADGSLIASIGGIDPQYVSRAAAPGIDVRADGAPGRRLRFPPRGPHVLLPGCAFSRLRSTGRRRRSSIPARAG